VKTLCLKFNASRLFAISHLFDLQLPKSQAPVVVVAVSDAGVVSGVAGVAAGISLRRARAPHKSGDLRWLK